MKKEILSHVVHPVTQKPLKLKMTIEERGEIIEGELVSDDGMSFPIQKGVANFVRLEQGSTKDVTEGSFSKKWNRAPDYGIAGPTYEFQKEWFLQRYCFTDELRFRSFLETRSCILDAGAGVGRNVRWFGSLSPNSVVFGVDISTAAYHAYANTRHLGNVHIIRGDITQLPFKDETFDYISCDQVIHHTPNPPEAFSHLVRKLKPGGEISCYVYKKKAALRELADDYIRSFTTRMTEEECWEFSEAVTKLGRQLSNLKAEIKIEQDIALLGIKSGTYDVQRLVYWHFLKCFWNKDHGHDNSVLTNFDWYHPQDAFRYTPKEFRTWFALHSLVIVHEDVQESGISIHARKGNAE